MLRSRIYLGEINVRGAWQAGAHPALVDVDTWDRAQAALRGRRQCGRHPTGERTADMLLVGFVRCACGRRCTVAFGRNVRYYACTKRRNPRQDGPCDGPYVRADHADADAAAAVVARIGALRTELERPPPTTRAVTEDFAAARRRIESRLARAVSLAVEGTITGPELAAQRARLDGELAALAGREATAAREVRATQPEGREAVRAMLADLAGTWAAATCPERREMLALVAERCEAGADGLQWTWRPVADLVREA